MKSGGLVKNWLFIVFALIISVGILTPGQTKATSQLDKLLQEKNNLQRQADEARRQAAKLKKETISIKGIIEDLDSDISYKTNEIANTESQIRTTNDILSALSTDIGNNQAKLDELNGRLKAAYVNLYEMSQTSTIELILQSDSLDDIISRTQYVQSIQTDLQQDISQYNTLRSELESKKATTETQKSSLEQLNSELTRSKNSLNSQRSRKDFLLSQTLTEQAKQEQLAKKLEGQKETLDKKIYDLRRANGGRFSDGGTGGYPWPNADVNGVNWLTLFYYRQCTDFAAWRFEAYFGIQFRNTRPGNGNAWNWPNLARDQGFTVSSTPKANSLVTWDRYNYSPNYGHVAWVTKVNGDGTIDVAEYNFRVRSGYGERYGINPIAENGGASRPPLYITP